MQRGPTCIATLLIGFGLAAVGCGRAGATVSPTATQASASRTPAIVNTPSGAAPAATDVNTPSGAGATAVSLAQFGQARNRICVEGSNDIAGINATMEGMTPTETSQAFRDIAERTRAIQLELDVLVAPTELADFVEADKARRQDRIGYVEQLALAVVENPESADEIDRDLEELNIETEREEDIHGFAHCP